MPTIPHMLVDRASLEGRVFTTRAINLQPLLDVEKETIEGPPEAEARGVIRDEPHNAEATAGALERPITPAHFVRCHFDIPLVGDDHRVRVEGGVERPASLDVKALRSLGFVEELVTLECAGNGRLQMAPLAKGEPWDVG